MICYLPWFLSVITKRDNFRTRSSDDEGTLTKRHFSQLLPGYQTATLVIMFTKWPLMKDLKRNFADTPRTQNPPQALDYSVLRALTVRDDRIRLMDRSCAYAVRHVRLTCAAIDIVESSCTPRSRMLLDAMMLHPHTSIQRGWLRNAVVRNFASLQYSNPSNVRNFWDNIGDGHLGDIG